MPASKRTNARNDDFRALFDALPDHIKALAIKAFEQFEKDPSHTSLRVHKLKDNGKGNHLKGSVSVSINKQYRAIYVEVDDWNVWYWIGTHADYDRFTGGK